MDCEKAEKTKPSLSSGEAQFGFSKPGETKTKSKKKKTKKQNKKNKIKKRRLRIFPV